MLQLPVIRPLVAGASSLLLGWPSRNQSIRRKRCPLSVFIRTMQMLHLLVNELLSSAPVDANGALAQLNDSLRLARLMLFDLDTEIMHHVLTARRCVLLSAWDHKQVPVAVLLAAEAIKAVLHADAHQAAGKKDPMQFGA